MNTSKKLRNLLLAAIFAALTLITTAYILRFPIPNTSGYIHPGDAFIYLAAALLPAPYAIAAAALGAGLADLFVGATVYVLPTVVIKALMAACFTPKKEKIITARNAVSTIFAGVIMVGGYFVAEAIMFGTFKTPLIGVPFNCAQALASAVLFIVVGLVLDGVKVKERLGD